MLLAEKHQQPQPCEDHVDADHRNEADGREHRDQQAGHHVDGIDAETEGNRQAEDHRAEGPERMRRWRRAGHDCAPQALGPQPHQ